MYINAIMAKYQWQTQPIWKIWLLYENLPSIKKVIIWKLGQYKEHGKRELNHNNDKLGQYENSGNYMYISFCHVFYIGQVFISYENLAFVKDMAKSI